jgi:hypothetical protein
MEKFLPLIIFILIASNAYSKDIQLVNTNFLGSCVDQPITFLATNHQKADRPQSISVDIENGCYTAASVVYPKFLTVQEVKQALNRKYHKYESEVTLGKPSGGLWRNEDEKFAIQITTDDSDNILVLYVRFRGKDIDSCK